MIARDGETQAVSAVKVNGTTREMGARIVELRLPEPEAFGFADVAGVQIAWQFGHGESAVLVVPSWNFVDSRVSAPLPW